MRRLLWPLGLAAVLSSPMVVAQPRPDPVPIPILDQVPAAGGPLTLESALAMAAAGNPALAAAAKEAEALQGGVVQARVLPNPDIAFAVEDTRRDSRTTSVELGIPIELGGKRSARILAAERAQTVAVAEFTRSRAELRAATVAAFFDLLIAQEGVALATGSAQVAARAADIAARRVAAGKVPPLEETRARVERANADLEVETAQARLQEARRALGSLWGEPDPRFGQAVGSLDVLPARAPVDALLRELEQAPELAAHRLEIERRDAVIGVERSKRYPDVRLAAGTQQRVGAQPDPAGRIDSAAAVRPQPGQPIRGHGARRPGARCASRHAGPAGPRAAAGFRAVGAGAQERRHAARRGAARRTRCL